MKILIGGGVGYLLTLILLPFFIHLLQETGTVRPNFRQESIPVGIGLVLVIVYLLAAFLLLQWFSPEAVLIFLLAVLYFALLGLIDDLLGSRDSRGLKGHFGALFQGRLTTGALKALGGGLGALLLSLLLLRSQPWWEILTAALLIALAANTINLMDLRPGRAIKVFYLWFFILLAVFRSKTPLVLLSPLAGGLLALIPVDLKAKGMLGDTGSNLMGAALGLACAWTMPFIAQLILVVFLLLLHLFTEKYSLTEIIENNSLLRFLDNLGRDK